MAYHGSMFMPIALHAYSHCLPNCLPWPTDTTSDLHTTYCLPYMGLHTKCFPWTADCIVGPLAFYSPTMAPANAIPCYKCNMELPVHLPTMECRPCLSIAYDKSSNCPTMKDCNWPLHIGISYCDALFQLPTIKHSDDCIPYTFLCIV